ncbi:MAG: autoinducer binding domain-containing protein, partial [Pseudomonadota bacterium]
RVKYLAENYVRVDPVIVGCYQRFHPVDWKRLDWSSKAARAFQLDAIEHGVGNQGFSVPIRGPKGQFALFTVSTTCADDAWTEFTDANRRDLILIAHYFNEKALEFEPDRIPEQSQNLSPREIDAMTMLAMGYSRAQTAETLSISEHTLRVYIESARFKLGAMNTTHAVARAMSRGLIVV